MSTFEGKLHEESLEFIRIDEFQPRNYDGTAFFLSHFHTDHFKGIFDDKFLKVLVRNEDKMLYCTAITKQFLLNKKQCKIPSHKIFAMTVNAPILLLHEDQKPVQVTAIPAAHCPGSVMFLFEQDVIRVLYTGDFRINPSELSKFKSLHDKDGVLKKIKSLYLDTTFCDPRWLSFPSRKQTEEDLIELARDWLESNADHEVGIFYNSYHGLEHLLIELSKSLKIRIWVIDYQSYANYSCIAQLHSALSSCKLDSRVHLCPVGTIGKCEVCNTNRSVTMTIKPCAITFNQEQLNLGRQKMGSDGLVRIAYSMHCSLEELISIVKYLSPDAIYPSVIPKGLTAQEVLDNLECDVEELKRKLKPNENMQSSVLTSPPAKKLRLRYWDSEDEKAVELEEKPGTLVVISSSDEGDEKPLSQSSIDSPPL